MPANTFIPTSKKYELSNLLGNVLAVVSDRKNPTDANANGVHNYYRADVTSATDYYAFGMAKPGRSFIASSKNKYRYGFNGQEQDNEVYGAGNSTTAMFWQYDARLGRRWNVNPKANPSISIYATFANNPLMYNDPYGDTIVIVSNSLRFKVRIRFKLIALRVLGPNEVRHMVKDLNKHPDFIEITDNALPGASAESGEVISMHRRKKYGKLSLAVRKVKSNDKIRFFSSGELATLANELSHQHDRKVEPYPRGRTNFYYKNFTESTRNDEIKSNRIENLVHKRFFSRSRVEGTHYGSIFSSLEDVRDFKTLIRRRHRDNLINKKRLERKGEGNYKIRDTTSKLYEKSSLKVKASYGSWRKAHIDDET